MKKNSLVYLLMSLMLLLFTQCRMHKELTTESGLQYKITKKGKGLRAEAGDKVYVHYTGKFTNDTVFDSSVSRGEPIAFVLGKGQVIKGWDEGIALLNEGGKAQLVIPPDLAYGSRKRGSIPANSTLVFDVELLKVIKQPKPFEVSGKKVNTLESGVQWVVLKRGKGKKIGSEGIVSIHYSGYLKKDTVMFDSSIPREQSIEFPMGENAVVPGMEEGLRYLRVGDVARLVIPSELAYGDRPVGRIPANSDLIYDIEVLSFQEKIEVASFDVEGKDTVTTESGLKYIVIDEGKGENPEKYNMVKVHYVGYFTDGRMFDSSYERGRPFEFELGVDGVIKGWEEGLQLMKEGAKCRLLVPWKLGYGKTGMGPIPPMTDLIFDVELLEVK